MWFATIRNEMYNTTRVYSKIPGGISLDSIPGVEQVEKGERLMTSRITRCNVKTNS